MRFGSLFAGVGGMDLGLEWAGMTCAWQVEIDNYRMGELKKLWPDVSKYKDVRDVGRRNLEPVDLIAGGFPCQPHSVAGKRRGAADDRNLWPEYFRIIKELKPRYVLAENVPGIVSTYLDTVLSDLEGEAYTCGTFNIPACAFDAPHRRERIFIVAYTEQPNHRFQVLGKEIEGSKAKRSTSGISRSSKDVSNSSALLRSEIKRDEQDGILSKVLADASSKGLSESEESSLNKIFPHAKRGSLQRGTEAIISSGWWAVEPRLGDLVDGLPPELAGRFIRVDKGCPNRVKKLQALGDAVVPQVAEWIGRRIMEYDNSFS